MKVVVDSRDSRSSGHKLKKKVSRVFELLEAEAEAEVDSEQYENLKTLATILQAQTSLAHFASPSPEQVVEWVKEFLAFLERRDDQAAVRTVPVGKPGCHLLLTNAPDAAYMVDSVLSLLTRQGIRFQLISHPILTVRRKGGRLLRLGGLDGRGARESFIIVEIDGMPPGSLPRLAEDVRQVLGEVLEVAADQREIVGKLGDLERLPQEETCREFWRWLKKGNFHPFSYRSLVVGGTDDRITLREEGSLGMAAALDDPIGQQERPLSEFREEFQERIRRPERVVVEESEQLSPLLRSEPLVHIAFRESLSHGGWREHIFRGLFSQQSVEEQNSNIPVLRRRIEGALKALWVPEGSHDYRKTMEIFNSFPKVELFFMNSEELTETVRSFTLLYRRGAVRVIVAHSMAVRGLTLLILMPRTFFSDENLGRIENYLGRYFNATAVNSRIIHISTEYLSVHVGLKSHAEGGRIDLDRIEKGLTNLARPWKMKLQLQLERHYGEVEGGALWQRYRKSFSREYRALVHPRFAIRDVRGLEKVLDTGEEQFDLWGPFSAGETFYRIQFYSDQASYLNEMMPFLENLSLCVIEEVDFVAQVDGRDLYIKSFAVRGRDPQVDRLSALRENLLEILDALRRGQVENDYLNRLLLPTGLSWREIDVFRGYRHYYFQLGSPYSKRRVAFALINNPQVALLLFRYFTGRFKPAPEWEDPLLREEEALFPIRQELITALETVSDINEDNILRILFNLIDSTVRTNFFLRRDQEDYFFSFKISALGIIEMPAPRPLYEIYVHSATMEGIHLRGGRVARGGIRWSDRLDDFRTEILGLMKTQVTKNALIVPVGSKGGFIVKTPFATREEGATLSRAAYQTLIRGLLDLTDNRVGNEVVRPKDIVAYDELDPYLVVAADKGTAHLPDTANEISAEYGFWLDDAFASGGSQGYDHKKLGITARGAWECVKFHFREQGVDIQDQPVSVAGIGDMSGDVFGNGMLLSRQIRLMAAFNHRHIFLDPDPDPAVSFGERQRLFNLPRSTWDDYDPKLISEGGGVFPRESKNIPLSPQVRKWLGVRHESMDGQGLIRMILASEVDLLWNGGIGTYVRGSGEKDEEVGDRENDAVRIEASQLRAMVVGEGGNLGLTQRGRIEYALAGGRINTDAVDNSGGVDCSDHEVNLKIFMEFLSTKGVLKDRAERDRILEEVSDPVCRDVLADNYGQHLCLSLDSARCAADLEPFLDLAERLEHAGLLDRRGEFLPKAKDLLARGEARLTRPELAILMAYSKMQLFQALVESDLSDRDAFRDYLLRYFPGLIRERFGRYLPDHPLAREITATIMTNTMVDRAGSAFANGLARQTGASLPAIVTAYLTFDQVLDGAGLRHRVLALDNRMPARRQQDLLLELEGALATFCRWALVNDLEVNPQPEAIAACRDEVGTFIRNLGGVLPEKEWHECRLLAGSLEEEGLDAEAALFYAVLPCLENFLPVRSVAEETGEDLYGVARTFNEVRAFLGLQEIGDRLEQVQVRDRWDRMAGLALREGFTSAAFDLTRAVLHEAEGNLEVFFAGKRHKVRFYQRLRENLRTATQANYHPFTVILRTLEAMID